MAPYGYQRVGDKGSRNLEIVDAEADMIRAFFTKFDEEDISLHQLEEWARATRVSAPQGELWYRGTIQKFLRKTVYKGDWEFGNTIWKDGKKVGEADPVVMTVPAIVDPGLWARVQIKLDLNRDHKRKQTAGIVALRGRIRCECGQVYARKTASKKYHYLLCVGNMQTPSKCKSSTLPQEKTELAIMNSVIQRYKSPEHLEKLIADMRKDADRINAPIRRRIGTKEDELNKKLSAKARLLDLYGEGRFSKAELDHKVDGYQRSIDSLEDELSGLHAELAPIPTVDSAKLREQWEHGHFSMIRDALGATSNIPLETVVVDTDYGAVKTELDPSEYLSADELRRFYELVDVRVDVQGLKGDRILRISTSLDAEPIFLDEAQVCACIQ